DQAPPIPAGTALRGSSVTLAIAPAALRSVRPRHPGAGRVIPPGKRPAGNAGGQAEPAVPKTQRLAHGPISRRGENAHPDGTLPRRTGPAFAAGGLGISGQTPFAGSGRV